jgi:hypothetical protein
LEKEDVEAGVQIKGLPAKLELKKEKKPTKIELEFMN